MHNIYYNGRLCDFTLGGGCPDCGKRTGEHDENCKYNDKYIELENKLNSININYFRGVINNEN